VDRERNREFSEAASEDSDAFKSCDKSSNEATGLLVGISHPMFREFVGDVAARKT
jgi:hypothetical protein